MKAPGLECKSLHGRACTRLNEHVGGRDGAVDRRRRELVGRQVGLQQDLADLRPVAVAHHELGALRERGELLRNRPHARKLLRRLKKDVEKSPKDARTRIFYKNVMAREEAMQALTKAPPHLT